MGFKITWLEFFCDERDVDWLLSFRKEYIQSKSPDLVSPKRLTVKSLFFVSEIVIGWMELVLFTLLMKRIGENGQQILWGQEITEKDFIQKEMVKSIVNFELLYSVVQNFTI